MPRHHSQETQQLGKDEPMLMESSAQFFLDWAKERWMRWMPIVASLKPKAGKCKRVPGEGRSIPC
jgi:hypothetical protein